MSRRTGSDDRASTGASNSLAGSVFAGQWRVLRRLRAGGSLYAAEQVSTGRSCVLRVLDPGLVHDDKGRLGFEAVCAIRRKVASDHVVDLIDAGVERKSGAPWFAMPFLEGEALASRAATPMLAVDVHEAVAQLAHGLDALHAAGARHGRVSESDVLVVSSRYSGSPFTVVIPDAWVKTWAGSMKASAKAQAGVDVAGLALVTFQLLTGKEYGDDGGRVPASERAEELGCERPMPDGFDAWFSRCHRDDDERFITAVEAVEALAPSLDAMRGEHASEESSAASDPKPSGSKRAAASPLRSLRSPDYFVPAALLLVLAVSLGVRQFVKVRRARSLRDAPPAAVASAPATPPSTAPSAAPSQPPSSGPPRLDDTTLQELQRRLGDTQGAPVWIAVAAADPAALAIAERLQGAFQQAGWQTHPILRSELRARPGLFVFGADERPPSYVESAVRALEGAGLTPTVATGYRAYYEERRRAAPDYRGIQLAQDQTWVIAVGRGQ